jgi:pimeloyl-ACP methyl ester carboxylesterase
MRSAGWYVRAAMKVFTLGLLGAVIVMVRYVLKTPQPLKSVLPGEEHFYKWTHGHIFYKVFGASDAPPLVVFHAPEVGASSYEMRHIVEGLAKQYRVYALDLLGFGLSNHPKIEYTAQIYVLLYEDFLRDVVGKPAVLVASGLSCNYCAVIAQRTPELCSRLVFFSPLALSKEEQSTRWYARLIGGRFPGFLLYTCLTVRWSLRLILARQHMQTYQQITTDELSYASAVAHQLGAHHAAMAYLAGKLVLNNDLNVLRCDAIVYPPTLIIRSDGTGQESIEQWDISNQWKQVVLEDSGLHIHEEHPTLVVQHILSWLEDEAIPTTESESSVEVQETQMPVSETIVPEAYCVKCRKKQEMRDGRHIVTKNGRNAMEGTCPVCGTRLFRFVAQRKE